MRSKQNIIRFVKHKHQDQYRAGKVPVWHHLAHVSQILEYVLKYTKEGGVEEREIMKMAAWGHDILEDTEAMQTEIEEMFGKRGYHIIRGMTNELGDRYKKRYIAQMVRSEETIRLIKLSDLHDNITSALYNFDRLGAKWMTSYFLPIVTPMRKAIAKTKFKKYKRSAMLLLAMVELSASLLDEEVRIYKKNK